ncbi:hypothetical protein SAY86_011053 [Trapa natans]|uniref:B-like cyclin n=1 Tax=Trapa natans TaxID=22666 RepID=A0AAN7R3V4_TRANT|nr:hypothetical protein SAY86_011053 [Trapa natans]
MEFQLEYPLLADSTEPSQHFLVESDHMPSDKYGESLRFGNFDHAVRQETIGHISQICSGLDRLVPYLSVNYLDRFLSSQKLPQTKPWALRLIALSCVSLATKMLDVNFSPSDLQVNGGFIFDSETLQRMEFLILGALQWRMRSITPFSFISFFVPLFQLQDLPLKQALRARAAEIIFRAQTDINLLGFKPSIVAASALLCASKEIFPVQFSSFHDATANCSYVNKDHFQQCYYKMQEVVAVEGYEWAHDSVSRSDTPSNVLDQQFGSAASDISRRVPKRRRTSGSVPSSSSTVLS